MISIRVRLTLWYIVVLAIILLIFAGGVYAFAAAEERAAVDRVLRERADAFARAFSSEAGEEASGPAILEVARDFARGEGDVLVYDAAGKLIFRSPIKLLRGEPNIDRTRSNIATIDGVRCIAAPVGGYVFVATESLARGANALRRLRQAFIFLIPVALLIAALGGYFLASRSLAPVAKITDAASRIEAENLSERIRAGNSNDELGRLAAVLNALLERLERSFAQQKQLLADTSHELRTPVSIIRSEAEVTLSRDRDAVEYRKALEVVRSESAHLTSLIDGVLMLARADANHTPVVMESLDLRTVIDAGAAALRRVAESRSVTLTCDTNGSMPMRGNAELLRRMLLNLLDNAIKFTGENGRVRLEAHADRSKYLITVSDTGRGIPIEAQAKVFDRFFRADPARARDSAGGAGLGLPIARWIARSHGGDITLVRSSPDGSTFEVTLPV